MELPLWFRVGTSEPWRRAKTSAISGSRLSFTARRGLTVGTPLHMRFLLGIKSVCSEVACQGRIIRVIGAAPKPGAVTYAASIEAYKFSKGARLII